MGLQGAKKTLSCLHAHRLDVSVSGFKSLVTNAATIRQQQCAGKVQGTARRHWAQSNQPLASACSVAHACKIQHRQARVHVCAAVKVSTTALEQLRRLSGLQALARDALGTAPQTCQLTAAQTPLTESAQDQHVSAQVLVQAQQHRAHSAKAHAVHAIPPTRLREQSLLLSCMSDNTVRSAALNQCRHCHTSTMQPGSRMAPQRSDLGLLLPLIPKHANLGTQHLTLHHTIRASPQKLLRMYNKHTYAMPYAQRHINLECCQYGLRKASFWSQRHTRHASRLQAAEYRTESYLQYLAKPATSCVFAPPKHTLPKQALPRTAANTKQPGIRLVWVQQCTWVLTRSASSLVLGPDTMPHDTVQTRAHPQW